MEVGAPGSEDHPVSSDLYVLRYYGHIAQQALTRVGMKGTKVFKVQKKIKIGTQKFCNRWLVRYNRCLRY